MGVQVPPGRPESRSTWARGAIGRRAALRTQSLEVRILSGPPPRLGGLRPPCSAQAEPALARQVRFRRGAESRCGERGAQRRVEPRGMRQRGWRGEGLDVAHTHANDGSTPSPATPGSFNRRTPLLQRGNGGATPSPGTNGLKDEGRRAREESGARNGNSRQKRKRNAKEEKP